MAGSGHGCWAEAAEAAILAALARRRPGATICPSEAARRLDADGWRARMPEIRAAASRMAADGRLVVTLRGTPVDPAKIRGPVRFGLP